MEGLPVILFFGITYRIPNDITNKNKKILPYFEF